VVRRSGNLRQQRAGTSLFSADEGKTKVKPSTNFKMRLTAITITASQKGTQLLVFDGSITENNGGRK